MDDMTDQTDYRRSTSLLRSQAQPRRPRKALLGLLRSLKSLGYAKGESQSLPSRLGTDEVTRNHSSQAFGSAPPHRAPAEGHSEQDTGLQRPVRQHSASSYIISNWPRRPTTSSAGTNAAGPTVSNTSTTVTADDGEVVSEYASTGMLRCGSDIPFKG